MLAHFLFDSCYLGSKSYLVYFVALLMLKTVMTKLRYNQSGAAHLLSILLTIVVIAIGLVGWKVWDNKAAKLGNNSNNISNLKGRSYSLYLDGATSDDLVNYYKIGLNIKLENSNSNIVDPGSSAGPGPCPEVSEDYAINKSYQGTTLHIKLVNYTRVENPKELTNDDPKCKSIHGIGEKSFDLDKNWLKQTGDKTIQIDGLDNNHFALTSSGYKLTIKNSAKNVSQIPFYPDKVAVMVAWGDDCPASAQETITQYVKQQGIALTDQKYPGLEAIYRRPKREVNVILDGLKDTDGRKFSTDLGGNDCYILTTKPNLKSLDQVGLPYQ